MATDNFLLKQFKSALEKRVCEDNIKSSKPKIMEKLSNQKFTSEDHNKHSNQSHRDQQHSDYHIDDHKDSTYKLPENKLR